MCGIVGIALKGKGGLLKKTEDAFYDMLFADTLRGDDSTGIIFVEQDSSFGIIKEGLSAPDCIGSMRHDPIMREMWSKGKAFIGHNRKKTVGKVSDETAHPFVVDDKFAMVHNGTLYGHKILHDTEVDSEALTILMSKHLTSDFNKAEFEESIGKVNGAFAIAAYSQDTHKVYLTRNKERPLYLLETAEGWVWASEGLMLMWICSRNGLTPLPDTVPELLPEHCLVSIDLETDTVSKEEYVPKKAITPVTHTGTGEHGKDKTYTPHKMHAGSDALSKNQFKKLKRRYLGQRICIYAEDYVEKFFPRTIEQGETIINLLGDCSEIIPHHLIEAEFDISDLKPNDYEVIDCYYYGTVAEMSYDYVGNVLLIKLVELVKVAKSIPYEVKHEVSNLLH